MVSFTEDGLGERRGMKLNNKKTYKTPEECTNSKERSEMPGKKSSSCSKGAEINVYIVGVGFGNMGNTVSQRQRPNELSQSDDSLSEENVVTCQQFSQLVNSSLKVYFCLAILLVICFCILFLTTSFWLFSKAK